MKDLGFVWNAAQQVVTFLIAWSLWSFWSRAGEPERLEPHDLAGAILFYCRAGELI